MSLESIISREPRIKPVKRWRNVLARRIAGRLLGGVLVLWAAVTLAFLGVHLAPGDIVSLLIGEQIRTPAIEAAIRAEWGLNEPLWWQYCIISGACCTAISDALTSSIWMSRS